MSLQSVEPELIPPETDTKPEAEKLETKTDSKQEADSNPKTESKLETDKTETGTEIKAEFDNELDIVSMSEAGIIYPSEIGLATLDAGETSLNPEISKAEIEEETDESLEIEQDDTEEIDEQEEQEEDEEEEEHEDEELETQKEVVEIMEVKKSVKNKFCDENELKKFLVKPTTPRRRSHIASKLAGISGNYLKRDEKSKSNEVPGAAKFDVNEFGALPPPDYYYRTDIDPEEKEQEDELFEHLHYTPVGRNAVEMGSRFYAERNIFSYLTNTTIPTDKNYYDDEEVDLSCYTQKPVAYIILGKPGIGKTTLARQLADNMNSIYISPEEVVEFYKSQSVFAGVLGDIKVNEILDSGGSIDDKMIAALIQARVSELDVLHRGYVMDGFPMVISEELSIEEQIAVLNTLTVLPRFVFVLNMQDADLYKRRIEQKYDAETSTIYGRAQYSKFNPDENVFPAFDKPSTISMQSAEVSLKLGSTKKNFQEHFDPHDFDDDPLDGSTDFLPLKHSVIWRLIFRTEDNPMFVSEDLEQFRNKLPALQAYVEKFDKRNVLELDAYWAPSVIYKRAYDFLQSCGVTHVPIPVQILKPLDRNYSSEMGEFLGEDDDSEAPCPDSSAEDDIDWESAVKAVSIRGLVDPRFRWRISRWQNYCPVSLKYGRSIIGQPELATAFLDKVFFMSTPDALEQFIFNPRPYLLPKMPTSPIKFFILGHPLAGKSSFAKELAFITNSTVVDMNAEIEKRYGQVKQEYMYRKRLKYTLETKLLIDKENHQAWKRQERARRREMHKWVDDYIRGLAEKEIRAALEADRDRRHAERIELRKDADGHRLQLPSYGIGCGGDDGLTKFCWKDFVRDVHGGKTFWSHQELLELAWNLFHDKRLYYKRMKRKKKELGDDENLGEDDDGVLVERLGEEDDSDNELMGEQEEEDLRKLKSKKSKRRRRRRCKKVHIKPQSSLQSIEEEEEKAELSSDIDPNDNEIEESIRMRYPMIPLELVDIIPQPSPVPDLNPSVQDIVERKLTEDGKYADTVPPELYVEVLKHATAAAEGHYHTVHSHGTMTGGWVVENLITDIEKFRLILRTPEVCPDQVFVLMDRSENRTGIYSRLKRIFTLQNAVLRKSGTVDSMMRMLEREMQGITGEGGFLITGPEDEDLQLDFDFDVDVRFPSALRLAEEKKRLQALLLPKDDLTNQYNNDSPSNLVRLLMDANRGMSPAFNNEKESWENLLTEHEKYILDQVRSKVSANQGPDVSYESYGSEEIRRHIATEFKSLNCEMNAYVKIDSSTRASSAVWANEQIKEDVKAITEYLRHSRELGNLAYSKEAPPQNPTTSDAEEEDDEEEVQGEGNDDNDNNINTPDGMRTATALSEVQVCQDVTPEEEKLKCLEDQQKESPKRRFFVQIRLFDEFWNMAIPVCNEQKVPFWEVGLIDQKNARDKATAYWDQLENRFTLKAKRITENELREEQEEIQESLMKWGAPYEHNNPKGISSKENVKSRKHKDPKDSDDDDESEDDESDYEEDRDELASFTGKPDQYNKLVKKIESQRLFGDMKFYCPVTLAELNLLQKGSTKFAAKFRDRLYYCVDEDSVLKFVADPMKYLTVGKPNSPPPPKICVTGSPGCGQEEVALKLTREYNICYVNFRQRLHELMKARFGRDLGPNKTAQIIQRNKSEKRIAASKSKDDMLKGNEVGGESPVEDGEEKEEIDEEDDDEGLNKKHKNITTIHPILLETKSDELKIDEAALRSLGLLDTADLKTVPIGNIERTERLTERRWKKLTKIETHVQAFIENGIQLPDIALDEFIAPLWKEDPFNQVGFVLVGFPNTQADVEYLVKNRFIPEMVYMMECKQLVIRNRLITDAVDRWHKEINPSGKKKTRLSLMHRLPATRLPRPILESKESQNSGLKLTEFSYQTEGRPVVDEYEIDTWSYNDKISVKITKALKYYHSIYSNSIREMKIALNKNSIDWLSIQADVNVFESKRILTQNIVPRIKYRSSLFEDTIRLTLKEADALLNRGYFVMSRFQSWDPVELSNGNTAVNLWNSSSILKIPILYRRAIYFLAGEKNATHFEQNCWTLVNQNPPMSTVPAVVVVMGPPKSGKTTLAKKLANRLGLVYISGPEMVETVIKHSFVSQFGDILHELEPTMLAGGPQPMLLAEEILNYIRNGQAVPKFIVYRALDMLLQQPKAQYHGVVCDDYPVTEEELQEMLYRGVVPSTVIKLNVDLVETIERCARTRKPEYNYEDSNLPEEGMAAMEYATSKYNEASETAQYWFLNEVQNTFVIDGTLNMEMIYLKSAEIIKRNMKKMQDYLMNVLLEKPSTLEGTCPLTSQIPLRLSPEFGFYCPVALNERDELIRVNDATDLSEVVEHKGHVYLFSSPHNARKFLAKPDKYIPPTCKRTPPKDFPTTCILTPAEFEKLKCHWGFLDFDPVRYFDANQNVKGLEQGDPKFCVVYRNKLYCFTNEEHMKKFMKRPERYAHLLLPMKLPRKAEPLDMDKITPYCYLIAKGLLTEVRKVIQLVGDKRPKVLFMNQEKSAALFMAYYFKSQNMKAPIEIRQKYRSAMFDIVQQKQKGKQLIKELEAYNGPRVRNLPDRLKTQIDELLKMESMTDEEKCVAPKIPWNEEDMLDIGLNCNEIRQRYDTVKHLLHEAEPEEFKDDNKELEMYINSQVKAMDPCLLKGQKNVALVDAGLQMNAPSK